MWVTTKSLHSHSLNLFHVDRESKSRGLFRGTALPWRRNQLVAVSHDEKETEGEKRQGYKR